MYEDIVHEFNAEYDAHPLVSLVEQQRLVTYMLRYLLYLQYVRSYIIHNYHAGERVIGLSRFGEPMYGDESDEDEDDDEDDEEQDE